MFKIPGYATGCCIPIVSYVFVNRQVARLPFKAQRLLLLLTALIDVQNRDGVVVKLPTLSEFYGGERNEITLKTGPGCCPGL